MARQHPANLQNIRFQLSTRLSFVTIKLFVAVVEERSILHAAAREAIAPSAASKRLADLEDAARAPLLTRRRGGVEPTELGKTFFIHARRMLRDLSELESDLVTHASGISGRVRVFANESALFGYLPEQLATFGKEYPDVRVDLQPGMSPEVVAAMIDRAADIGLYAGRFLTEDLEVHRSYSDEIVLIAPKGHPLSATERPVSLIDIVQHDLIQQEENSSIQLALVQAASDEGISLRSRYRAGGFDTVCRLVEAGLGLGFLPDGVARRLASAMAIDIIHLAGEWVQRQHWICALPAAEMTPASKLLLAQLSRCAHSEPSGE